MSTSRKGHTFSHFSKKSQSAIEHYCVMFQYRFSAHVINNWLFCWMFAAYFSFVCKTLFREGAMRFQCYFTGISTMHRSDAECSITSIFIFNKWLFQLCCSVRISPSIFQVNSYSIICFMNCIKNGLYVLQQTAISIIYIMRHLKRVDVIHILSRFFPQFCRILASKCHAKVQ